MWWDDRPLAAELGVLVAQRVQRVRVAGDDPVELAARDRRDVVLGERLEQPLLADAADVVAGVALAVVEDPEVDAGLVEQPGERAGDPLRARVEGRVVADEPEHVDRLLARVRDVEVELGRPAAALALVLAERVARLVDHLERRLQRSDRARRPRPAGGGAG